MLIYMITLVGSTSISNVFYKKKTLDMEVEPTSQLTATTKEPDSVRRSSEHLSQSTPFSRPQIPSEVHVTLTFQFWRHFPLGLPSSWFTQPPFPSPEQESTRPVASEPQLSTTKKRPGMTKYVINCFHMDTFFYIKTETNDVLLYDV